MTQYSDYIKVNSSRFGKYSRKNRLMVTPQPLPCQMGVILHENLEVKTGLSVQHQSNTQYRCLFNYKIEGSRNEDELPQADRAKCQALQTGPGTCWRKQEI